MNLSDFKSGTDKRTAVLAFRLPVDIYEKLMERAKPNESKSELGRRMTDEFLEGDDKKE